METLVVKISPDGKTAEGLYSDVFPWDKVGELDVRRASDVKFNNDSQMWEVHIRHEDGSIELLPDTFAKRSDAIDHEIKFLQGVL